LAANGSNLAINESNLAANGLKSAEKCTVKEMEAINAYCKYGTKLLVRVEVSGQSNEHESTIGTRAHEGPGLGSSSSSTYVRAGSSSSTSGIRSHDGTGLRPGGNDDNSTNDTNISNQSEIMSKRYVWKKARAIQINNDVVTVRFMNTCAELSLPRKVRTFLCIYVYFYT
jgi:hypothetical protein